MVGLHKNSASAPEDRSKGWLATAGRTTGFARRLFNPRPQRKYIASQPTNAEHPGHHPVITDVSDEVFDKLAADDGRDEIPDNVVGEEALRALLSNKWFPCKGWQRWGEQEKLTWLRAQVIGGDAEVETPFGCRRKMVYVDHTASGKSLHFVEDFMLRHVLPFYGNTHTEDSMVGGATSRMVHESEVYIKKELGGGPEDVLLFCGSGATAALKRLQEVIGVAISPLLRSYVLKSLNHNTLVDANIPQWVVFTGPYEHHSNLLSWRQSLAEVVEIPAEVGKAGKIDMVELERALERYTSDSAMAGGRKLLLGSFSAGSNVTGLLTDTRAVSRLLHRYGAYACFDFAAAGPHAAMEMRSNLRDDDGEDTGYYDAVVMSPHKMMGGPGTPGLLLMRRSLYGLQHTWPSTAGGGTVAYVNGFDETDTLYYDNVETREDAGTPQILGKIRCALTLYVKQFIGVQVIQRLESMYFNKAIMKLSNHPNIEILGHQITSNTTYASILSFVINPKHSTSTNTMEDLDKPLHGRFVVKLLNDLFGIQARGGCACAGPYGHLLLGVDRETSLVIRDHIMQGYEGLKPGWTRVSLCYNMTEEEVDFVLSSINWVANYGHLFLGLYDFDWKTGNWTCVCSFGCSPKPNIIIADGYINDYYSENATRRLRFRQPLQLAKALSHTLPKYTIMRQIPKYIDARAVLFRM